MKEEIITFETATLAKEKGFLKGDNTFETFLNHRQNMCYDSFGILTDSPNQTDDFTSAPTQSLLQRWLREEHSIDVFANSIRMVGYEEIEYYTYSIKGIHPIRNYRFKTYEQALEVGLFEALKLIKL